MKGAPTHSIIETASFTRRIRELKVSTEELAAIYDAYACEPGYGVVIRKTGGLRKGRIAKADTGKSGGYRVFSLFMDGDYPVFLLWVIDKSEEDTLTDAQANAFRRVTGQIKEELRK
jgi:hypothetical protein